MPNAAEIIEELSEKLAVYRMFAMMKGYLTDEAVAQEVAEKLQSQKESSVDELL